MTRIHIGNWNYCFLCYKQWNKSYACYVRSEADVIKPIEFYSNGLR